MAQDFCNGDHDYDGDCDATDVASFLVDFGRSPFNNPCPTDGPAPVAKTGQFAWYHVYDDGDLERGVAWPNPRFTDNSDGTVTDNLTGLMWTKDAHPAGETLTWEVSFDYIALANLWHLHEYNDWRFPNLRELQSLIDYAYNYPALPAVYPFENVHSTIWSSTTFPRHGDTQAWSVDLCCGSVNALDKTENYYIWPVRGGH